MDEHAEILAAGRVRNKLWRQKYPQRYMWIRARLRAKTKGVPFTIKPEDIPLPPRCEVFGFELAYGTVERKDRDRAASLDRIKPALGYVPGNIRVISFRANFLLSTGTLEEFETICEWLSAEAPALAA